MTTAATARPKRAPAPAPAPAPAATPAAAPAAAKKPPREIRAPHPDHWWGSYRPVTPKHVEGFGPAALRALHWSISQRRTVIRADRAQLLRQRHPAALTPAEAESFAAALAVLGELEQCIHRRRQELAAAAEQGLAGAFLAAARDVLSPADFAAVLQLAEVRRGMATAADDDLTTATTTEEE